jgi:glycosyltransferase involved in cell wall biosynthesis
LDTLKLEVSVLGNHFTSDTITKLYYNLGRYCCSENSICHLNNVPLKPAAPYLTDSMNNLRNKKVVLIVPCYNEEQTIAQVILAFKKSVPHIACYVFDNNSTDNTVEVATAAGAQVYSVPLQGKGNVVRRMFADVEADVYVMVDGDATYDASVAPDLIQELVSGNLDMVVGSRRSQEVAAYRPGHRWGNKALTGFVSFIFGRAFDDMLSGYRIFSRRYAKSFPAHSKGFEIETELAVHALELRMPVKEIETVYGARPEGSVSKLNTYRDGVRILMTIIKLFKAEKPLMFFFIGFLFLVLAAFILAAPLFVTYFQTGLVPRMPTAILCSGLVILSFLSLACGLILDTVTRGRLEVKRLAYLSVPSFDAAEKR